VGVWVRLGCKHGKVCAWVCMRASTMNRVVMVCVRAWLLGVSLLRCVRESDRDEPCSDGCVWGV
jgi:hypothetical protein